MAIKTLQAIDLTQNELQNARIQNLASDPGSPVAGQVWFNTTGNLLSFRDNSVVKQVATLQNKITDLAVPTSTVSMGSQIVSGVATPVAGTDAANKSYVDNMALGLDVKASVRAATTVAGTLATSFANGQVVDGVTLVTGDRILIKNQAAPAENGIYVVAASGAPTRATDCDSSIEYTTGAFCLVEMGTVNAGAAWVVQTQGAITPGTTSVTWVQFAGGASSSANALTGGATGAIPYQSAASTTNFLSGNTAATDQVLVSHGTGAVAQAPTLTNAPALSAANMTSFPTVANATSAVNFSGSLVGDVTGTQGATAVVKVNGLAVPTTKAFVGTNGSGQFIDATSTVTTAAMEPAHTGDCQNTAGSLAMTVKGINGVTLSGLATGLLYNTTATGVPSIATAAQVVSSIGGTAVTLATSATNLAAGTVGQIPYQTGASTTAFLAGNTAATDQVLVSHGTGAAALAPTLSNAPALSAANMTSFPASVGTTHKYAQTFGDGSTTSYVITHNLASNDVIVGVYFVGSPFQVVQCEVQLTSTNTITLLFAVAPASNSLRVVVIG